VNAGHPASAPTALREVHVVLPSGVDDTARPSGGNTYDRRVCRALTAGGWHVSEHLVTGAWPLPRPVDEEVLAWTIAAVPDDAVVLIDGLIASAARAVLVPESYRLRLVPLVHMPLGFDATGPGDAAVRAEELAVLSAARAVVTTSSWTRRGLLQEYSLPPDKVYVAQPGVDSAGLAPGTPSGSELLCVAAVTASKGHADLLAALAHNHDLPWRLTCVGVLDRDPELVRRLRRQVQSDAVVDRVSFTGPLTGQQLDDAYAAADVLVLASHAETYGMVVTEALAHGLPVLATAVGGVPDALGWAADAWRPGLLVVPGDPLALAGALRSWLLDAELRRQLRKAARQRRSSLPGWDETAVRLAHVLAEVAR
jgi:glycosyltransferase involved in cell wall biosynthesis